MNAEERRLAHALEGMRQRLALLDDDGDRASLEAGIIALSRELDTLRGSAGVTAARAEVGNGV